MSDDRPEAGAVVAVAAADLALALGAVAVVYGQTGNWVAGIFGAGAFAALATRVGRHRHVLVYFAMVVGAVAALQAARSMSESLLPLGPILLGTLVARAWDRKKPGLIQGPFATALQVFGVWVASDLR